MKKKGNISIKAKLLGIIIPVVIAIILILVFTAYHVSSGIIESYSKNLLESSVNSQASKIEAWLEENLASMQMAKNMIEKLHPDEAQLQTILDASCGYSENYPDGLFLADANGSFLKGTDSKKQEPNPKESMWYQEGMTRVNMAVGSAHQNPDGTNVVSASGLLNDGSDTVRVIGSRYDTGPYFRDCKFFYRNARCRGISCGQGQQRDPCKQGFRSDFQDTGGRRTECVL